MSSAGSRAFGTSSETALKWVGATKQAIFAANPGERGEKAVEAITKIEKEAEGIHGSKAHKLIIQGTKLHKSTKEPKEALNVITVSVESEGGTRLESDHAREDGTFARKLTRAGSSGGAGKKG